MAVIDRVQAAVPLHAPDHPAKNDPLAGTAVSFTLVPELKEAVQVGEQLMPAGLLVTVPLPVPANWSVSWNVAAAEGWAELAAQKIVAVRMAARK